MRLQNKNFTFKMESGDNPISRILTSNVVIDGKLSDILISDLFYGIKKERKNVIKGYSPLEFVASNKIQINERTYELTFTGDKDNFVLQSITDPTDFILNDKIVSDDEIAILEKRIQDQAPVLNQTEQPPVEETSATRETDTDATLFKNEDYENEKQDLEQDGFVEYNTSPKSNMRLLVNESALPEIENDDTQKLVLIEIEQNDFSILIRENYKIELNSESKTFTYDVVDKIVDK